MKRLEFTSYDLLILIYILTTLNFSCGQGNVSTHSECNNMTSIEYRGTMNKTKSGIPCQYWNTTFPHPVKLSPPDGKDHNYCRNPDSDLNGLWCYTMNPDRKWETCYVPKCDPSTRLLVSFRNSSSSSYIMSLPVDPDRTFSPKKDGIIIYKESADSYIRAITTDVKNQRIYFSDSSKKFLGIINLTNNQTTKHLQGMCGGIESLAYDWVNHNIYWTDSDMKWVMVSDFNLEYYTHIYRNDTERPLALAIHPTTGLLFFSTYYDGSSIKVCDLAGKNVRQLVIQPHTWKILSMSIDYRSDKLYWTNHGIPKNSIMSCNLDGSNKTTVFKTLIGHYIGIASYKNHFFVADNIHYLHDNYNLEVYYQNGLKRQTYSFLSKPNGLAIYESHNYNDTLNDKRDWNKNASRCAQLSLPRINASHECACTFGYTKVDSASCERDYFKDNFMILSDNIQKKMFQLSLTNETTSYTFLPIDSSVDDSVTTIALSAKSKTLYWSNRNTDKIYKSYLNGSNFQTFLTNRHAKCIKIDYATENVYFSDVDAESIYVTNRSGLHLHMLINKKNTYDSNTLIRSIALDQRNRMIYWTAVPLTDPMSTHTGRIGVIKRMGFDGSNPEIVLDDLHEPGAIAISHERNCLFFSINGAIVHELNITSLPVKNKDMPKNNTRSCGIKDASLGQPIHELTIEGSFLYITVGNYITKLNLSASSCKFLAVGPKDFFQPKSFAIYNAASQRQFDSISNPCLKSNCSHLCLLTPNNKPVCVCGTDYKFVKNSTTQCIHISADDTPPSYGTSCPRDSTMRISPCVTTYKLSPWTAPTWTDDTTPTKDLNITVPLKRTLYSSNTSMLYPFEYSATDKFGNTGYCTFMITVFKPTCKTNVISKNSGLYFGPPRCANGQIVHDIKCLNNQEYVKYRTTVQGTLINHCTFSYLTWSITNYSQLSCVASVKPNITTTNTASGATTPANDATSATKPSLLTTSPLDSHNQTRSTSKSMSGGSVAALILLVLVLFGGLACLVYYVRKRQLLLGTGRNLLTMFWKKSGDQVSSSVSNQSYNLFY